MAKKKTAPADDTASTDETTPNLEPIRAIDPDADEIPDAVRRDIIGLFASGKPVAAFRRYIEHTGCDLQAAKDAVLELADGQPVPEGWELPGVEVPPLSPEEQVVFPADEGWTPGEGNVVNLPKPKRPALTVAPAEPVRPPKDKVTKKEESRRFPLSDQEIEDRHALLCTETLQDAKQELTDKQIRAEITERRKARKARLQELAGEINDRATTRLVTVVTTISYERGLVTETVDGTGEVLTVKPLSGPDVQVPLPLPTTPPADVVVTEDDGAHD
jgi:hypothetical protein